MEPFFIGEILPKGTAEDDLRDENGHIILAGDMYAEINWLEKITEGKKLIKYQWPRESSLVLMCFHEIFVTNAALNESLSMSIGEYQSIISDALLDYVL